MSTLFDKQLTFTRTLSLFLSWMVDQHYDFTMGDCWRSNDELLCPHCGTPVTYQELLKYNGRSKTLQSKHVDRLAVDINLFVQGKLAEPKDYIPLGEKWKSLGGVWGGDFQGFPDYGHFEI